MPSSHYRALSRAFSPKILIRNNSKFPFSFQVYRTAKQNKDKGIVSEGVLLYGFGDGGGGPS